MSEPGMAKAYNPKECEEKWYDQWDRSGHFHGHVNDDKESYTIVIPPPNVTGVLTLGHVLNNTLQDILIRWQKMMGKEVCWVPGTDHAGIATQAKVEAYLKEEESLTRFDLGREKFLGRVWEWKEKYGGTIIRQLKTLGVCCDWRRERFTLDDGLSDAVQDVFIRLYEKGLIYKGKRMINWCPKSHTALSDEEVIYRSAKGSLWYINYPIKDGSGHITVATTRPETMPGDTGIAVNPDDDRFKHLIGQSAILPLVNREIPIFADDYVDKEFGTGAVKVTPAHDPNDYEMGLRHDLKVINVMNEDASLNEHAGNNYKGLDRYVCREKIIQDLKEQGYLDKIEDYENQIGYSERGYVPVEPLLSEQWFVDMKPLAEPALKAVNDGRIRFHPERWVKTYNHWMENIKDWCISRQLWWGHRIPAYYCNNCKGAAVSKTKPESCAKCSHTEFHQDKDVLDTWFSSWLWPFSVFDWPKENADLSHFYPTQSLVTGPDIIFFWVARMIMSGLEFMGEIPFKDVYFTSIIRDDKGRKLSKSLNNSPDPLDVIETYGADALRYTVIYIAPVGQDIRYSNEKCEIGRNFANKLWNAARFRQIQGDISPDWQNLDGLNCSDLRPDDRWLLSRLSSEIETITQSLTQFDFHRYAIQLYEFIWNEFCDWYVESAKTAFYSEDESLKVIVLRVYDFVFSHILRLMHPVMPFVTEELYSALNYISSNNSIMIADWPQSFTNELKNQLGLTQQYETLVKEKFNLIKLGRNLRGNYNIPYSRKISYIIKPTDKKFTEMLQQDVNSTLGLLNADNIDFDSNYVATGSAVTSAIGNLGLIFMPLTGVIDIESERKRLVRQKEELEGYLASINKKLENENFLNRAPEEVIQKERDRMIEYTEKIDHVSSVLNDLSE